MQILNWITNNEYGVPHNLAQQGLLEGTGKWFFAKEEYKEWRSASASSILWLHGIRKYTPGDLNQKSYGCRVSVICGVTCRPLSYDHHLHVV